MRTTTISALAALLLAGCGDARSNASSTDTARAGGAVAGTTPGGTATVRPDTAARADGAPADATAPRAPRAPRAPVEAGAPAPAPDRALGPCAADGPARDTLCFHGERALALDPGGAPFRLVVDARGARPDSMDVVLRLAREDTTWHRAQWTTRRYGAYDRRPPSADSLRRRTAAQLARLLDVAWSVRPTASLHGTGDTDRAMQDAILFDLAESGLRARHHVAAGAPLPVALYDSLRADSALAPRARALVAELRERPAYRYHAGGELTSGWAWSPRERRMVRVFECC